MAFTKFTDPIDHIANLSDRPNDTDGMNAQALKAAFDQGFADTQDYLNNTLIPELEAGADNIEIDHIEGLIAENIQAALEELKVLIDNAVIGSVDIPDGGISTVKLADLAVTTAKLADSAVATAKLADLAVTAAKLAANAVETAKIKDRAVTGPKIALAGVTNEHLGSKVVKQDNLDDNAVGTAQIADNAVTFAKTNGVQKKHVTITVNVPALTANTEATVTGIAGVTATNTVIVSPAAGSWSAWREGGVRCSGQGNGSLKFISETAVSAATEANVVILD